MFNFQYFVDFGFNWASTRKGLKGAIRRNIFYHAYDGQYIGSVLDEILAKVFITAEGMRDDKAVSKVCRFSVLIVTTC